MLGEDLHAAQLVAAAPDRDAFVERPAASHLELAQDGETVIGNRRTDPRDHRIVANARLAIIEHLGLVTGDMHRAAQRVEDVELVPAILRRLLQAAVRIEIRIARQHRDFHGLWPFVTFISGVCSQE